MVELLGVDWCAGKGEVKVDVMRSKAGVEGEGEVGGVDVGVVEVGEVGDGVVRDLRLGEKPESWGEG